jgi:hypothetical protein
MKKRRRVTPVERSMHECARGIVGMRGYAGGGFGLLLWLVYYYYVYGLSVMMSCMLLSVGL